MKAQTIPQLCLALLLAGTLLFGAVPAAGEIRPSSDVLMPYFEVELKDAPDTARTTLFAICNDADVPVSVMIAVSTNWGIPVLEVPLTLAANEVKTVNLRDWLLRGELPGRKLSAEELSHLQAALSGQASPRDGMYYSTAVAPGLAVGSVTFRTSGGQHQDALWGDYFIIDPKIGFSEGETLVNIDPAVECQPDCKRHGVRFLTDGPFDGGTELMVWTERTGAPAASPELPQDRRIHATLEVYDEAGHLISQLNLALLPNDRIEVADLGLSQPFGWIDLVTDKESFITAHFSASGRYSSALHAYCLPEKLPPVGPRIYLEKMTNGEAADLPTGPRIPVGGTVHWTYLVTNNGDVKLAEIFVTDSDSVQVTCPADVLEPGESMTCEAQGVAAACQHSNTATATGRPPSGGPVSAEDTSHYYGEQRGALSLEARINGQDADAPPGPDLAPGDAATWTYEVANTGPFTLSGILVTDQHGSPVSCPNAVLAPGEAMTCTATALASAGQHAFTAAVQGQPQCGPQANASDPTHYRSLPPPEPLPPSVTIKKFTNGQDADTPPGPTLGAGSAVQWTYVVTNTGGHPLVGVTVTDDHGVAVTCPKAALTPGESMTCTASGTAERGPYRNVGAVTATPPSQAAVTASDPSHYFGILPRLQFEKLVNGFEADHESGAPILLVGGPVLWTYVVTNTGDTVLTGIAVTDDRGVAVSCPKTALALGESMICTGSGTTVAGLYCNVGTVTAYAPVGPVLTATDPACYRGMRPGIAIEKRVNGQDADAPTGPKLVRGSAVQWTYMVTNTGDTALTSLSVTDDQGVDVTCPKTALEAGESMTCTAGGTAVAGQYCNLGTVSGLAGGSPVQASDPACYFGVWPAISLEKLTNGEDADTPPGPELAVGSAVLWTYVVTNTGDVPLTQVSVTDDRGVAVTCPKTVLQPGESMACAASGTAVAGQYANLGTASGKPADVPAVTASDPSHYFGRQAGSQGCTPGYWKNHTDSWPPAGYSPSQAVDSVFANVNTYYPVLGNATLLDALSFAGGPGGQGAAEILLRAAVAALLNGAHPGVAYPRTAAAVIAEVNTALLQNRDAMLALAAALDADNNLGCPLN